jgi:hypothetical protein
MGNRATHFLKIRRQFNFGGKFCENFAHSDYTGVDVMITIFCDFCQFSAIFATKLAFFSKQTL